VQFGNGGDFAGVCTIRVFLAEGGMRHAIFIALFFGCVAHAGGISNEYGKFLAVENGGDYSVTFILNSENKKFAKIQKVEMIDRGNDGEGDISVLSYKSGNKEVFFRTEDDYKRYVLSDASRDVCENDWSPKIVYRKDRRAWACSKINFLVKFFMWREIDSGLVDAKEGDWDALAARIIENVGKIKK